ncbi:MAG TPA: hypothetical protein VK365_09890 [Nocardioidaceae bacterium]|nr:hypothetical protein [Nocardioidaceae bacterium]
MSDTAPELPRSARLACWYSAFAAGACSLDDARDAVIGGDAAHDVLGLRDEPVPLVLALGMLRATGADVARLALPAPGDLTGLGGPPGFNADALEAGEAVLLSSELGLVPSAVGAGVTWRVLPANQSHTVPDLAEADTALRETLLESSARLADLDVPRWRPEAAEGLQALRRPPGEPLPAGFGVRAQRAATLALRCLALCDLALDDDGGAVSAWEAAERRDALGRLARAARHALMAACSAGVRAA